MMPRNSSSSIDNYLLNTWAGQSRDMDARMDKLTPFNPGVHWTVPRAASLLMQFPMRMNAISKC